MQPLALNQPLFSLTLFAALIFGILFSAIVHWASRKKWVGQTAWAVVIGVSGTLLLMIPIFGIQAVAVMFAFFGMSGGPMIVEYLLRVQQEIQQDLKDVNDLTKDLLNERQAGDR
jgi:predicted PurR-regulated permease PerM